jgi:hypothetical protein
MASIDQSVSVLAERTTRYPRGSRVERKRSGVATAAAVAFGRDRSVCLGIAIQRGGGVGSEWGIRLDTVSRGTDGTRSSNGRRVVWIDVLLMRLASG